jgi:hypothetical protein
LRALAIKLSAEGVEFVDDEKETDDDTEWYYSLREVDIEKGPVSYDKLIGLIKDGTLALDDMVWRYGMDDWEEISTIPELNIGKSGGQTWDYSDWRKERQKPVEADIVDPDDEPENIDDFLDQLDSEDVDQDYELMGPAEKNLAKRYNLSPKDIAKSRILSFALGNDFDIAIGNVHGVAARDSAIAKIVNWLMQNGQEEFILEYIVDIGDDGRDDMADLIADRYPRQADQIMRSAANPDKFIKTLIAVGKAEGGIPAAFANSMPLSIRAHFLDKVIETYWRNVLGKS